MVDGHKAGGVCWSLLAPHTLVLAGRRERRAPLGSWSPRSAAPRLHRDAWSWVGSWVGSSSRDGLCRGVGMGGHFEQSWAHRRQWNGSQWWVAKKAKEYETRGSVGYPTSCAGCGYVAPSQGSHSHASFPLAYLKASALKAGHMGVFGSTGSATHQRFSTLSPCLTLTKDNQALERHLN